MPTLPERVTKLETVVSCLPDMQHDIREIRSSLDQSHGRDGMLRLIVGLVAGSGLVGLLADYIMFTRR